ncbi:MAG: protein kinase [Acidobacteriota bacterium]|nr:protein kinase [Acidobacteriota bacterium]
MTRCPSCSTNIQTDQSFCGSCGCRVDGSEDNPTQTSLKDDSPSQSFATGSFDQGRFVPGTVLEDRYRIVALLGKGGMGEVYRADDLKLGQTVALKFLPASLEPGSTKMTRLFTEVRMARQVSHPNVCAVYDIGELDGLPFISMEYVDGEDLASLLRRIGRLPKEKGLQTARQICAGLAAAHEQGILHRDLKPANVMIDGRGRVKLTDFGLAGLTDSFTGDEIRWGTPAYMAPEQLSGKGVSARSDIYALGLVLYELVTGKKAFSGKTPHEIAKAQQETMPTSPANHVSDVDDAVERVILRCLERDPTQRPGSALAVSAALPGGDPLAAALAAGETPSPEMVADAGVEGGLSPRNALILLGIVLLGLVGRTLVIDKASILNLVPMELSGQELKGKAEDALVALGHVELPDYLESGFRVRRDYIREITESEPTADHWDDLRDARPPGIVFWYRRAPSPLKPSNVHAYQVTEFDPPLSESSEIAMQLDTTGRLHHLEALPPENAKAMSDEEDDWTSVLKLAGWDASELTEIEPLFAPTVPTTRRIAWEIDGNDSAVIQVGAYGSLVTHFRVIQPWERTAYETPDDDNDSSNGGSVFFGFVFAGVIGSAIFLARRNIKSGRSDVRGALRLFFFVIAVMLASWLALGVRLNTLDLGDLFFGFVFGRPLAHALLHASISFVVYMALEPYVRKLWPRTLVSWSRLLLGRFRDPLLGREVLIGMAVGGVLGSASYLNTLVASWTGGSPFPPTTNLPNEGMLGAGDSLGTIIGESQTSIFMPMLLLVVLLLFRLLLRRDWAAVSALMILFVIGPIVSMPDGTPPSLLVWAVLAMMTLMATLSLLMLRIGLVAGIAMMSVFMLSTFPVSLDTSRWYAGAAVLPLAIWVAIALWAFYAALAGRKIFGDSLLSGE